VRAHRGDDLLQPLAQPFNQTAQARQSLIRGNLGAFGVEHHACLQQQVGTERIRAQTERKDEVVQVAQTAADQHQRAAAPQRVPVRPEGLAQSAIDRRQRKVGVNRQPPFLEGECIVQHEYLSARLHRLHRRACQPLQARGKALLYGLRQ
jgi:hypothetical protein